MIAAGRRADLFGRRRDQLLFGYATWLDGAVICEMTGFQGASIPLKELYGSCMNNQRLVQVQQLPAWRPFSLAS
jgi:hypothetical protein